MTITEFLLARIAEDEAAARAATEHRTSIASHPELALHLSSDGPAGECWTNRYDTVNATHDDGSRAGGIAYVGNFGMDLVQHIARHDPARVLAECEAKRATMLRAEQFAEYADATRENDAYVFDAVLLRLLAPLASVYADHPDYDQNRTV